jgi:ABC-type sugar transport system substrate-binding protein
MRNFNFKIISLLASVGLLLGAVPHAFAAGEVEGKRCVRLGAAVTVDSKNLICTLNGKRLLWTAGSGSVAGSPIPAGTLSSASPGGTSSTWVKWDKATCSLVPATAPNLFPWRADLRTTPGLKIGYGTQAEGIAVVDLANESMKSKTAAAGATYVFANYANPDAAKLLDGVKSIITRQADVVVSWALIAASMDNIMSLYKAACIPVIQVSAAGAGALLFGPDNALVGKTEGEGLIAYAKKRNWNRGSVPVTALQVTAPGYGASINLRSSECVAAIQKAFPNVVSSKLVLNATTTAEGLSRMNDWLTGNPNARRVLACNEADTIAFGVANAAAAKRRLVGVGGVGGSKNPGGNFVGTVDFGFKNYGSFLVPLAQDLVQGKPVPTTIAPFLRFATDN